MKAAFSSIIMDSIKFWTFTTSQCLSAKQYFPVLNKREQQEYRSKLKPLLALSVWILMAPTLFWLLFIASSCFMWQCLPLIFFLHVNLSISHSRAGYYTHFREQKKTLRCFGCRGRAALLEADLYLLKSHLGSALHLHLEAFPIFRQAYTGWESKACIRSGGREWASPRWLLGALSTVLWQESSTQKW